MKRNYHFIPIAILAICILIFGFTFNTGPENSIEIIWSERSLNWEDFQLVNSLEGDNVATIYSNIICPDLITENKARVYAFMDPKRSERLRNEYDAYNVLVHEQYHFNLTEYCARLLRKDIVERGLGGQSFETMKTLRTKYSRKLDSLQTIYDSITDHNIDTKMQRYWELKIGDWLRQTSAYQNENIYSYYNFTKNRTSFFKSIYFTQSHKVLTSYPVGEQDLAFGQTYEVLYPSHKEKVIKFYKNGKLANGGYFRTAITRVVKNEKGLVEIHYYNPDESYNTKLSSCIRKIEIDPNSNTIERYFDENEERVYKNSVYETQWKYDSVNSSYFATYLNKANKKIANEEGVFHEKRTLDEKERAILLENFDHRQRPKNDKDYIARYESTYNENNLRSFKRMYDENGAFAFHLNDYHLTFEYDQSGRTIKVISLDGDGKRTYDRNGACIYEYTYDLYDRQTSVKRFNADYIPVIGIDDFFQKVMEFDEQGRAIFEAEYYPEYVLRFSDTKDGAQKYVYENDNIKKKYNYDVFNNVFENDLNVAITVQTLNAQNQIIKETYFDANENYAKTDDGSVTNRYKYDTQGNQIEIAVYDSIDKPHEFEADVASIHWTYNSNGNKLRTVYYNRHGELAHTKDSVTYNIFKYDKNGHLNERINYDIAMKPAKINYTYRTRIFTNKRGLDSLRLEYNVQNKLKKGVAITKYTYDKYGDQTRLEYFDAKYRRTKSLKGISAIKNIYNKRHLLTGYEYLDEKNRLTNNSDGVAVEKWVLDDQAHMVTYTYFDKHNTPVIGEYGYHKIEQEWAEIGQTTKTSIFGSDNELIEDEFGIAIYEYTLTSSGLAQIIERYNKEGVRAVNNANVVATHYEASLNGLYYLEKELDLQGEVVNDTIPE